jgi:hypothetical protein
MFREELVSAIIDYRWLLDRHYPQRSAIQMAGDRYMLTGYERSILYRGVSDSDSSKRRFGKITSDLSSDIIVVDCYNVLFTLSNYLLGKPVYISDDGFLRDAGESRGRINNKKIFNKALILLKGFISDHPDKEYFLLVDAPISNSGKLTNELAEFLSSTGIKGSAEAINSPDSVMQEFIDAVICTSDSGIIDKTSCKVYDLPGHILKKSFASEFFSVMEILKNQNKSFN